MPTILKLDNWPKYMLWLHLKPPANSSSGWEEELFLVSLSSVVMHTDCEQYKMGATGWHSISEYHKTKNNIKNKGSTHRPLLPPWCFFSLPFFWTPVSRNPPPPPHSQQIQLDYRTLLISVPSGCPSLSQTSPPDGGKQGPPWGACSNGAGAGAAGGVACAMCLAPLL